MKDTHQDFENTDRLKLACRPKTRTAEKRGSLAQKDADQQDDGGASSANHDVFDALNA